MEYPKGEEEYNAFYSSPEFKKEEEKKRKKEEERKEKGMRKWEKASRLRKIFMYHPETPSSIRYIAFLLFLLPVWDLLKTIGSYFGLSEEIRMGYFGTSVLMVIGARLTLITLTLILFYGLSHLKRWFLYLSIIYTVLMIFDLLVMGKVVSSNLIWSIVFIIALINYKKFRY